MLSIMLGSIFDEVWFKKDRLMHVFSPESSKHSCDSLSGVPESSKHTCDNLSGSPEKSKHACF